MELNIGKLVPLDSTSDTTSEDCDLEPDQQERGDAVEYPPNAIIRRYIALVRRPRHVGCSHEHY